MRRGGVRLGMASAFPLRPLPKWALLALAASCRAAPPSSADASDPFAGQASLLPTGRRLDPAGSLHELGQFPLTMVAAPGAQRIVLLLSGYRDQGVQVLNRATGAVTQ